MKIVEPDFKRRERCGIPEIIYGGGKTDGDLKDVTLKYLNASGRAMVTKLPPERAKKLLSGVPKKYVCKYSDRAQLLVAKTKKFKIKKVGVIGVITAGTSDIPIAEEARIIAEELGLEVKTGYDVGVAGVHRIYPVLSKMDDAQVLVVVAGMEGALPSVVSGLVDVPVIGVPTSVGYGTGKGGLAALNTMLNSCAPVAVVNIDNGFGAAVLAHQIIRNKNA